jgi:VWFA-related protein
MLKLLLFLCVAGLLAAQNAPPADSGLQKTDGAADPVIRETFKFVLAPVTVTDRDGSFVNGLTPKDFQLTDNGKVQNITEDIAEHPLSLVVTIQANADVEKILPQIKRLAGVFESLVLGDTGEMAVVAFDHRNQTLAEFTSDPLKIDAAFKKLSPGSYTSNLNDAAMFSINMLRNRPVTRRRILVLLSENRDKGSEIRVREVLTAAEFANVVIYSVNISQLVSALTAQAQPNRPDPIPAEAHQYPAGVIGTPTMETQMEMGNWVPALKDIFLAAKGIFIADPLDIYTRYTGGREFSFKTQKTLDRDISGLGEELHSQYMLTYSPNTQNEAGFHQIVVTVRKPDVKVRTRDGYWLAGKPE